MAVFFSFVVLIGVSSAFRQEDGKLDVIQSLFWDQSINDCEFHVLRLALAKLICQSNCVAGVVGVAQGGEVPLFARTGYFVHGIEPQSFFVNNLQKEVDEAGLTQHVRLHQVGAGETRSTGVFSWREPGFEVKKETALILPLDDIIQEHLNILSVDVHGISPAQVLKGAKNLINNLGVDMIWIEAVASRERVGEFTEMLFRLQEQGYVLFDFVWWGKRLGQELACKPPNFYTGRRSGNFSEYFKEMVDVQESDFHWLQTDLAAVQKTILTPEILQAFDSARSRFLGV